MKKTGFCLIGIGVILFVYILLIAKQVGPILSWLAIGSCLFGLILLAFYYSNKKHNNAYEVYRKKDEPIPAYLLWQDIRDKKKTNTA